MTLYEQIKEAIQKGIILNWNNEIQDQDAINDCTKIAIQSQIDLLKEIFKENFDKGHTSPEILSRLHVLENQLKESK